MKSMQARYIFEREGIETFETEKYFFTYKIQGDEFHCLDMYVLPEFRSGEVTHEMLNKIDSLAKESGSKFLVGTAIAGYPHSEKSLILQFRWGMKLLRCEENKIILVKEV